MKLKGKFKITAIKKKTQAVFFKGLKVGDEFELSYNLNGGYKSAPWIQIIQNGEVIHGNDALQLSKNLDKFEIEQITYDAPIECEKCGGSGFDGTGTGYGSVCSNCTGGYTGLRTFY